MHTTLELINSTMSICVVLCNLLPFVHLKNMKNTHGGGLLLVPKGNLLHGYFSRFLIVQMARNRAKRPKCVYLCLFNISVISRY